MKSICAELALILGLTTLLAPTMLAANGLGRSATFSVGATVVDVCQVANTYRSYIKSPSQLPDPQCDVSQPASDAAPEPVTTITRADNGEVTALTIEF